MFLGLLVFITALSISAVAIYYSIAGLVAIFAAAAIPIMIMGGALEIGKLVTAVWLHRYWQRTVWWLRTYLAVAVVVLMFITSMGIFGFLSKAHIEQTSASKESVEQVQRIETELARFQSIIDRAEQKIEKAESSTGNRNDDINAQIEKEQQRIDSAYTRIQPAIDEQQKIIADARSADSDRTKPYEDQLSNIKDEIVRLETSAKEYEEKIAGLNVDDSAVEPIQAQIANINETINKVEGQIASGESEQIKQAQLTIGSNPDGQAGPNTRRSANTWINLQKERISELQNQIAEIRIEAKTTVDSERTRLGSIVKDIREKQIPALKDREVQMLSKIDDVRATESPIIATARDEIARIRKSADDQVKASNELIQQLREKIKVDGGDDVESIIDEQNAKIKEANAEIDVLTEEKYKLEAEYRKLEAEVGPIKYIAELIYGENVEKDLLEKAVRWVIITIIFVFDPLAVLLLIASQYTFEWRRQDVDAMGENDGDKQPEPEPKKEPTPDEKMEEVMGDDTFEDVPEEVIEEEFNDDKEIEELLEKADPDVLEEVAKELEIESESDSEKEVDKEEYNPYTDTRTDEELTEDELAQRRGRKLYSPDGMLAAQPKAPSVEKKIKSIKIKSIKEKAEENERKEE
tara:strand:- start:2173 stop:4080 length:1908 start_codon:yes stop_codon:yes gene_type:complete